MSVGSLIMYLIIFLLLGIAAIILIRELMKPNHLRNQKATLIANILVFVAMVILLLSSLIVDVFLN